MKTSLFKSVIQSVLIRSLFINYRNETDNVIPSDRIIFSSVSIFGITLQDLILVTEEYGNPYILANSIRLSIIGQIILASNSISFAVNFI